MKYACDKVRGVLVLLVLCELNTLSIAISDAMSVLEIIVLDILASLRYLYC